MISFSAHFLPFSLLTPVEKGKNGVNECVSFSLLFTGGKGSENSFRHCVCTSVGYKITLNTFYFRGLFSSFLKL